MTHPEALEQLGVRRDTLSTDEKRHLDERGYLILPGVMSVSQADAMNARSAELARQEGADAGKELEQEPGADRVMNLFHKDPMFDFCFTHPRVLAAVARVLKEPFKLSVLNSRAALPGQGKQPLHTDMLKDPKAPGEFQACNSIWLLDDFTPRNGATRVVPGSHLWDKLPDAALKNPMDPHPDEIMLLAPKGTVVVFNSHLWHAGTLNQTSAPRPTMTAYYCRRCRPQAVDQRKYRRESTFNRLSPAARYLLDVEEWKPLVVSC